MQKKIDIKYHLIVSQKNKMQLCDITCPKDFILFLYYRIRVKDYVVSKSFQKSVFFLGLVDHVFYVVLSYLY
jgi:hypothetical protein